MPSVEENLSPPEPPTSISGQIELLQQRGMLIPDTAKAIHFLSNVNFYRFRGYLEPFADQKSSSNPQRLQASTSFDAVTERYDFDARLRMLLLTAFNHIEVSARTQWAYHLAYTQRGGEYSHLNPCLFSQGHSSNLASLKKEYQKHGKAIHRYDFSSCPIWAITEVMPLGQLSRWYGDTMRPVRRLIASHYQLDERILQSLLRHLAPVRNFCAHHERLWDKVFITKMKVPNRLGQFSKPRRFFNTVDNGNIYNTLVMLAYLTHIITEDTDWSQRIVALMNEYQNIPQEKMGFLPNWQSLDIWQK